MQQCYLAQGALVGGGGNPLLEDSEDSSSLHGALAIGPTGPVVRNVSSGAVLGFNDGVHSATNIFLNTKC